MRQDNILYFLCKSAGCGVESGKNVFDFIKKCIYNGRYQWIFALFYEERLCQKQNGRGQAGPFGPRGERRKTAPLFSASVFSFERITGRD